MNITDLRRARGLSLRTLSEWSGLPERFLSQIEGGQVRVGWVVAKQLGPHVGRTPFSLLIDRVKQDLMGANRQAALDAMIEIALAAGEPDQLTERDKRALAQIEELVEDRFVEGMPMMDWLRSLRRGRWDGFMPLPSWGEQSNSSHEPDSAGYMPTRRVYDA